MTKVILRGRDRTLNGIVTLVPIHITCSIDEIAPLCFGINTITLN